MKQGSVADSLAWVDRFFQEAGQHIFARQEDDVIILPPNQVYKANATGIAVVRHMLSGGSVRTIPGIEQEDRALQVAEFAFRLRALYLGEPSSLPPLETVPYSFQFTRLPILGEIAVTWKCNNACRFCYAGCGKDFRAGTPRAVSGADGKEMSIQEVKRILRIFREKARIPFFSFTGGEPLLRKDLEEMIRHARRLGLQVNLVTNGTLADAGRSRRLFDAGLRTAQVSIESADPAVHDDLTGSPGSWQRTLGGIRALQDAGVSVQTNTTVTRLTAAAADGMPAFLKSIGVSRFAMNLYIPGEGAGKGGTDGLFLPYAEAGEVIDRVRAAARREGLVFYWYSPIPHCHYNTIARGLGNKSCAAMDGLLSVSPAGDVLPCSSYPLPMGNLLRQDFPSIWFSERARFFKNKLYAPPECKGCDSFTACQAACPLYWKQAGTAEIRPGRAGAVGSAGGSCAAG
ncbi:MAG TPA: radical SAM protein [Spirochaetia bacterium]|nr:radical SAM protein [Spirochaetia bacterium]